MSQPLDLEPYHRQLKLGVSLFAREDVEPLIAEVEALRAAAASSPPATEPSKEKVERLAHHYAMEWLCGNEPNQLSAADKKELPMLETLLRAFAAQLRAASPGAREGQLDGVFAELKSVRDVLWNKSRGPIDHDERSHYELAHRLNDAINALGADARSAAPGAPPTEREICICAAVKFADGRIARGHRHDACFNTASWWKPIPDRSGHVQGFMTSRNRFVDREEGARLQNAAGIVSAQTGKPVVGELFSEDLYFDSHDHLAWARTDDGAAAGAPPTPETKE